LIEEFLASGERSAKVVLEEGQLPMTAYNGLAQASKRQKDRGEGAWVRVRKIRDDVWLERVEGR